MSLSSGSRIGSYEVVSAIGAGGMGEVYQARDTKLNRTVALKILPAAFATDPDRLARFKREAQVLAALNHPNIAAIYGFEDSPSTGSGQAVTHALVMEFVPGRTLAEAIGRPMPIAEALPIARQIASALEAAHDLGIVHRDLKPANIKITDDGTVKVLDFGLAKALAPAGTSDAVDLANSPTLTSPAMTEMGMILGTAGYMAPEQAKGKPVDRRADIWALGVVLFEMLAGRALFRGETATETIAHVITQPPAWDALPASTATSVRRLLRRCLEKDPRSRLQSAGDARIEIDEILSGSAAGDSNTSGATVGIERAPTSAWRLALPWTISALLAAALALALWPHPVEAPRQIRVDARIAGSEELLLDPDLDGPLVALSPDGLKLVYLGSTAGTRRLYVRPLDRLDSTPLAGTDGATQPFFSADGQSLGFFANGAMKRMSLSGGPSTTVIGVSAMRGGTWGPDNTIVYTSEMSAALSRVPASGGPASTLTTLAAGERTHRWPSFLPDGKAVLFNNQKGNTSYEAGTIEAVRLDTGERKVLIQGGAFPLFAAGRLIFTRQSALYAVPFDPDRLEVRGEPQQILTGFLTTAAAVGAASGNGSSQVTIAGNGTLAYLPAVNLGEPEVRLAIVDRTGKTTYEFPEAKLFRDPRFSPDGKLIALRLSDAKGDDIHLLDPLRETLTKITFDGVYAAVPVWSHDGKRLAYASDRGGKGVEVYITSSDGTGSPSAVTSGGNVRIPSSFSPDDRLLAVSDINPSTNADQMVISLADGKTTPFVHTGAIEMLGTFSPDGRWMAYQSQDANGQVDVFIRAYPDGAALRQASNGSGFLPYWTKSGRELIYGADAGPMTAVMAIDVTPEGPTLRLSKPVKLFELPIARPVNTIFLAANADGSRFAVLLYTKQQVPVPQRHVTLVLNFLK